MGLCAACGAANPDGQRLEHAKWLAGRGQHGEATELLAEARAIFLGLRAKPWLDRVDVVASSRSAVTA